MPIPGRIEAKARWGVRLATKINKLKTVSGLYTLYTNKPPPQNYETQVVG